MLTGIFAPDFSSPTMGNLKTYTMTYALFMDWKNGYKVFSNYRLFFPHEEIHSFKQLISILKNLSDVSLGLDELHVYMDNYQGVSKKNGGWYLKEFGRQTRKRNVKLYMTAQSYADVHKSIRRIIQQIWIVQKLHPNNIVCMNDKCHADHILRITDAMTGQSKNFKVDTRVFELYDTNQVIEWED